MIPTKVDAAIVGSGAGGAVMAYELAARGMSVAVIERGRREDPTTFEHAEMEMFPRLYKDGGFQTTVDRNLLIAQGATVGGSTVINNAIWLRADLDRLLPRWEQAGAYIDRQRIERGYEAIERLLKVAPVPAKYANKGNGEVPRTAREHIGLEASLLQNNRVDCIACGWCNYGCRYNRKTSALVTFIPWAEELGASVIDQALDARVVVAGDRATGVTFVRNRAEHTIAADRVVIAGGAIGSTEILLRSGITMDGRVGSRFHAFAGVHVTAEFPDELNSYDGIGLCAYIRPSIDDEMVLENYFSPPGVFSLVMGGWFSDHFERMLRYRYFAQAGVQVATAPSGRITLGKKGEVRVDFAMSQHELDLVCQGVIHARPSVPSCRSASCLAVDVPSNRIRARGRARWTHTARAGTGRSQPRKRASARRKSNARRCDSRRRRARLACSRHRKFVRVRRERVSREHSCQLSSDGDGAEPLRS